MNRIFLLLFFLPLLSIAQRTIPTHGGKWVHDEANVLSAQAISELEMILRYERDSTSNQIAVLIIPSLEGESLEDFSLRVAEQWKIGQKGKDNGVLLLIAMQERRMRIETGLGLEGLLTDAMSSRINRNEIAPRFRLGDYDGGVKAGVLAIIQVIKGEYKNDNPTPQKRSRKGSPLTTIIIIIVLIILASRRKGGGGGGYWSSGGGFIGPMGGGGFGGSSGGSWGGSFGGGGGFGGGGSSNSW